MAYDDTAMTEDTSAESVAAPVINRAVVKPAPQKAARKTSKQVASTAPKQTIRKTSAQTKREREALHDRTNIGDDELHEDDDAAESVIVKPTAPAKKSRARKADQDPDPQQPAAKKQKQAQRARSEPESQSPAKNKKKAKPKKVEEADDSMQVIPETQQTEISHTVEEVDSEPPLHSSRTSRRTSRQAQQTIGRVREASAQRTREGSVQRQVSSVVRRALSRERSTSDPTRRLGDVDLRRKLGDITDKYENIKLKYEELQDLGRNDADTNFDRLKRASDEKAKDAAELIASLKKELSDAKRAQTNSSTEAAQQKSELATKTEELERLAASQKTLTSQLAESANEIKSLGAKLEAARKSAAEHTTASTRTPRFKDRQAAAAAAAAPRATASSEDAYLKEELYRDLTGLIINSVKRRDQENEFNCIQTGRNGTLHFHLKVPTEAAQGQSNAPKTPGQNNNDDDDEGDTLANHEFVFEPFLDASRDKDLVDILPDYFQEEIDFPRAMAVKFFSKLVGAMTARVELVD